MTTITIERELLERAAALLNPDRSPSALFHQRRDCAEAVRAALAAPATAPERPNPYDACESFKAYQLSCRREAVLQKEIERLLAAPATAPDRHAQELLAQDITIANMRERHAQELCAYQITVDKLKAERKPMGTAERVRAFQAEPDPVSYEDFIRGIDAAEAHHGIGDKT